ncbi:hypothetical protein GUJ93_ZPchr0001g32322 [Zizania palustris]|uniref:Uncharacterized protein n=1 Tax=Zizania palustris TaxID=103762 RepID=A0A8J5VT71_ZIZPA|nr:hypothetical protein GUJ93_ZPchr0001g32322 [Zizania palustris]
MLGNLFLRVRGWQACCTFQGYLEVHKVKLQAAVTGVALCCARTKLRCNGITITTKLHTRQCLLRLVKEADVRMH